MDIFPNFRLVVFYTKTNFYQNDLDKFGIKIEHVWLLVWQNVCLNLVVSERNTTQRLTLKEHIKFQLYRLANNVVPNSFSQAKFICNHANWLKNKVTVITNMVDLEKFYPNNSSENETKRHIVTTARITRQKNILKYLKAITHIKRIDL